VVADLLDIGTYHVHAYATADVAVNASRLNKPGAKINSSCDASLIAVSSA
jgi:hypothetical protein